MTRRECLFTPESAILWRELNGRIDRSEEACMVRIQVLAKCASVLLMLAASAPAQPPSPSAFPTTIGSPSRQRSDEGRRDEDHRGESQEREAWLDAIREFMPHKEVFDLVQHASVRQEIGLNAEVAQTIEDNVGSAFGALHDLRKKHEGKEFSKEDFNRSARAAVGPFNLQNYDLLGQANLPRLLGLYVQARGFRAVLNDRIASEIGLEGEAFEKFRKRRNEIWTAELDQVRDDMRREFRNAPPGVPPARDAMTKIFKRAEERLDSKLARELTASQKVALEQLKGPEFELPERPFNFPPPPSSRERGGRGGPPRNDEHRSKPPDSNDKQPNPSKCSSDEAVTGNSLVGTFN